ncbi:hypothetical protein GMRT_10241 [Giardia muris]|uniref:FERM domain-containing protein n=1 Tax=Giardia muris TaxID=5742 RepID=A0A4Z1SUB5_GIAMU|nr:hypothetical protein GMRT_10241 [Giardia muris]|eukprot:TNJ29466.1 hypothetical protein GMRT_10241 [Giardia muris]
MAWLHHNLPVRVSDGRVLQLCGEGDQLTRDAIAALCLELGIHFTKELALFGVREDGSHFIIQLSEKPFELFLSAGSNSPHAFELNYVDLGLCQGGVVGSSITEEQGEAELVFLRIARRDAIKRYLMVPIRLNEQTVIAVASLILALAVVVNGVHVSSGVLEAIESYIPKACLSTRSHKDWNMLVSRAARSLLQQGEKDLSLQLLRELALTDLTSGFTYSGVYVEHEGSQVNVEVTICVSRLGVSLYKEGERVAWYPYGSICGWTVLMDKLWFHVMLDSVKTKLLLVTSSADDIVRLIQYYIARITEGLMIK